MFILTIFCSYHYVSILDLSSCDCPSSMTLCLQSCVDRFNHLSACGVSQTFSGCLVLDPHSYVGFCSWVCCWECCSYWYRASAGSTAVFLSGLYWQITASCCCVLLLLLPLLLPFLPLLLPFLPLVCLVPIALFLPG